MYILSQILVSFSDLFCIISMLSNKKKNVVLFLIVSTILFASHYICLGGWTGAAIAFIELAFLIIMYLLEVKSKTKFNPLVTTITIVVTVAVSVLTWGGWISVLPMFAMVIYLITMMFKNVVIVKSGAFIRIALNAVYMFLLASYFGAGLSLVILGFTIYGIIKDKQIRKTNN